MAAAQIVKVSLFAKVLALIRLINSKGAKVELFLLVPSFTLNFLLLS